MAIEKVSRVNTVLRIALTGPTNAGKTYSALRLAYGIVKKLFPDLSEEDLWLKICLIDSEHERGRAYANRDDLPLPTGSFLYSSIDSPYTPEKYIAAFKEAETAVGEKGIVIIDSLSHVWAYTGGVLDIHQDISKRTKNSYVAWNEAGKIQNSIIDYIMESSCYIICTMRSKMEYVLETDASTGKSVPSKVGLKPIQRDDLEYEFDITLQLDKNHIATIIKDITFLNNINFNDIVSEELGKSLIEWMNKGVSVANINKEKKDNLIIKLKEMGNKNPELITLFKTLFPDKKLNDLTLSEGKYLLTKFEEVLNG